MTYYATSRTCLRRFMLRYFGEQDVPDSCDHCSVCDDEEFEVNTGTSRKSAQVRKEERAARRGERRNRHKSMHDGMTAWERAMLDNLKTLRSLLASESHAPAYTIFSDASLVDMVKKHPMSMDAFLDVSGVGAVKQERYGQIFLAVIRDGMEPNDAIMNYKV